MQKCVKAGVYVTIESFIQRLLHVLCVRVVVVIVAGLLSLNQSEFDAFDSFALW